jgi:carboxyl-terminal processing protease
MRFSFPRTLFIATATLCVTGITLAYAKPDPNEVKSAGGSSTYELLSLFGDVFERVRSDYVESVSDEKLIESALNGMLTSLDPHSSYLNKKNLEEMRITTSGEFGGLGIEVTIENGLVKVVSPIDDTPAAKAGIKSGDFISEIDGAPVMGMTLSDAVEKMRGKAGTAVKLTVLREGLKAPLRLSLERSVIKIKSVRGHSEGDVAYVRVTQFQESTTDLMTQEINRQMKEMGSKMKGLVLDLRNDPGGLLDQAISVADAFLERGEIVSTRERDPKNTRRYSATAGDIINGLPMVVLINEGSASASEIVAGALKDHKRAIIVGVKSFGKGSVQTVIPIRDHGAIRLTTARYYTPSGISIQAKGIEPDILVEQAKVETVKNEGTQISEASLPGHLNNDQAADKTLPAMINAAREQAPKKDGKDAKESSISAEAISDYQLIRAIDVIRAVSIYSNVKVAAPIADATSSASPEKSTTSSGK